MCACKVKHPVNSHLILEQSNDDHYGILSDLRDGKKCDPNKLDIGDQFYVAYENDSAQNGGYLWYWGTCVDTTLPFVRFFCFFLIGVEFKLVINGI